MRNGKDVWPTKMRWLKTICLIAGTAIVGSALSLQAVTNVLDNDQPALAASVFPLNGYALEYFVTGQFAAGNAKGVSISQTARSLEPLIRKVLAKEPLTPRALTILALAQEDEAKSTEIFLTAAQVSRRPLLLQNNLLVYYASRNDFAESIAILNNMLAVHPEKREMVFPALSQALTDTRAINPLATVLKDRPKWGEDFMKAAARNVDTVDNIARVRMKLLNKIPVDGDLDKSIIAGLMKAERIDSAAAFYHTITKFSQPESIGSLRSFGKLDWSTRLPPFDWHLNSDPGKRAQIIENPERLEFFVKSGKAGIIAERLLIAPAAPFALRISHDIKAMSQLEDVRIQLKCGNSDQKFFDQPFTKSPSTYSLSQIPDKCKVMGISIAARAWSGKSNLEGEIRTVAIILPLMSLN